MSAKLTGVVWELDLPRPEKFVALALADHGKDDGTCIYPSLGRIEWKTGYSRTQVRQIMQSLVKMRLLFLVRKGGAGRGDCDEYRMEVCNIQSLPDFRLRNKGAETAPMPSASAVNIDDKVAKGTETAPIYKDGFPQKGAESDPIGGDKGAVPVDKGYGFDPEKGPETVPESKPNLKPRTTNTPDGELTGEYGDWIAIKEKLRDELAPDAWSLWVRPGRLLRVLSGRVLMIAFPPNGRIQSAALAHKSRLHELAHSAGYGGVALTTYPDEWQREQMKERFGIDMTPKQQRRA